MTKKTKLPAPRLQLRWAVAEQDTGHQWACHYELVLPLRKSDIRREVWKNGRQLKRELNEAVIAMKEPSLRTGGGEPCVNNWDGSGYCDTPYRDGAHAQWDSIALGGIPIFCISRDGTAFPVENHTAKSEAEKSIPSQGTKAEQGGK